MSLTDDIAAIARQEKELLLPAFNNDTAWRIGLTLRELAASRNQNIVADIRRFGSPHQQLFYTAFPGTTPDNQRWVQRKAQRRRPLPPQLLLARPLPPAEQHDLRHPLQPARRGLRRPRRLLPHHRRQRRHHRSSHRLRPRPARRPQPRRRSPLHRSQNRPKNPATPVTGRPMITEGRSPKVIVGSITPVISWHQTQAAHPHHHAPAPRTKTTNRPPPLHHLQLSQPQPLPSLPPSRLRLRALARVYA